MAHLQASFRYSRKSFSDWLPMSGKQRRGGYLATAAGAKKLADAKDGKGITFSAIAEAVQETEDKVKRLFNPQWGNGKYKVGREAVIAICRFFDLQPAEIVSDWYPLESDQDQSEIARSTPIEKHDLSYYRVLEKIEQAAKNEVERLDLSEMELTELPPEIGQLSNLTVLYLNKNSLPIPPEVLKKYDEPTTIINYYLSLQNNQKKPVHEAKMLLVGQGNVGKTCLRERLIRDQYDPTRNKTDGIDIEPWDIEVANKQLQINVWDFGGQEIMHSTHQFFLTKRSLYILVIDTTIGKKKTVLNIG